MRVRLYAGGIIGHIQITTQNSSIHAIAGMVTCCLNRADTHISLGRASSRIGFRCFYISGSEKEQMLDVGKTMRSVIERFDALLS